MGGGGHGYGYGGAGSGYIKYKQMNYYAGVMGGSLTAVVGDQAQASSVTLDTGDVVTARPGGEALGYLWAGDGYSGGGGYASSGGGVSPGWGGSDGADGQD